MAAPPFVCPSPWSLLPLPGLCLIPISLPITCLPSGHVSVQPTNTLHISSPIKQTAAKESPSALPLDVFLPFSFHPHPNPPRIAQKSSPLVFITHLTAIKDDHSFETSATKVTHVLRIAGFNEYLWVLFLVTLFLNSTPSITLS